jgi:hypothetical protein
MSSQTNVKNLKGPQNQDPSSHAGLNDNAAERRLVDRFKVADRRTSHRHAFILRKFKQPF